MRIQKRRTRSPKSHQSKGKTHPIRYRCEVTSLQLYSMMTSSRVHSFRTSRSATGQCTSTPSFNPTLEFGETSRTPWRRSFQNRIEISPPRMSSKCSFGHPRKHKEYKSNYLMTHLWLQDLLRGISHLPLLSDLRETFHDKTTMHS